MSKKFLRVIVYVVLFAAIASGVILRSVEVMNRNFLLGFDQGRDYLAVENIVVNHKLTLIGSEVGAGVAGFRGIFHGPLYYYLLALPFIIFRGDPYGGMILMFMLGTATILISFVIGKRLFGTEVGLLVAAIVAVSPPFIAYSRFIWNSNPAPLFILIAFYFVFLFTKKGRAKHLFWASFFSGFVYNFQLAMAIPLSLTLIIYCIMVLRIKQIKQYGILFLGTILAFSPLLLFEIRHGFQAIKGILIYMFSHPETATTQTFWILLLRDHLLVFFHNFLSTFPKPIIISSIAIAIFSVIFYFVMKEKDKQRKQFILYFLTLIPVTFIVLGFLRNFVYHYYLIHLNLIYIFLVVFAIVSAFKKKHKIVNGFIVGYMVILLLFGVLSNVKTFFYDISDYGGIHKIRGKIDSIDHIYKNAGGEQFGLLVFSPPIYTYPYDYLISWYGKKKYGYVPHQEKKGLVYLLIEKDTSKPWSYQGWLKTVIKEGDILNTEQLASGFIIQKRLFKE